MEFKELIVDGKVIGSIHTGTEFDTEDKNVVHINITPMYYQSGYIIDEIQQMGDWRFICD